MKTSCSLTLSLLGMVVVPPLPPGRNIKLRNKSKTTEALTLIDKKAENRNRKESLHHSTGPLNITKRG